MSPPLALVDFGSVQADAAFWNAAMASIALAVTLLVLAIGGLLCVASYLKQGKRFHDEPMAVVGVIMSAIGGFGVLITFLCFMAILSNFFEAIENPDADAIQMESTEAE